MIKDQNPLCVSVDKPKITRRLPDPRTNTFLLPCWSAAHTFPTQRTTKKMRNRVVYDIRGRLFSFFCLRQKVRRKAFSFRLKSVHTLESKSLSRRSNATSRQQRLHASSAASRVKLSTNSEVSLMMCSASSVISQCDDHTKTANSFSIFRGSSKTSCAETISTIQRAPEGGRIHANMLLFDSMLSYLFLAS